MTKGSFTSKNRGRWENSEDFTKKSDPICLSPRKIKINSEIILIL